MNPEGGSCSEPRSRKYTLAWDTQQDSASKTESTKGRRKEKNRKKEKKGKEEKKENKEKEEKERREKKKINLSASIHLASLFAQMPEVTGIWAGPQSSRDTALGSVASKPHGGTLSCGLYRQFIAVFSSNEDR